MKNITPDGFFGIQILQISISAGAAGQWHRERGDMGECPPLGMKKFLTP